MITKLEEPCWFAVCDYCGEGDNSDWGGSFHYCDEKELLDTLANQDWMIIQAADTSVRALYCFSCWDGFTEQKREAVLMSDLSQSQARALRTVGEASVYVYIVPCEGFAGLTGDFAVLERRGLVEVLKEAEDPEARPMALRHAVRLTETGREALR